MKSIIDVEGSRCIICCLLLITLFLFSSRQGQLVGDVYLLNICQLKSKFHVVVIDFNVNCKFWLECQLLKIINHSNFGEDRSHVANGVAEHLGVTLWILSFHPFILTNLLGFSLKKRLLYQINCKSNHNLVTCMQCTYTFDVHYGVLEYIRPYL